MKKVISIMAVVAFLFAANVNAQETQKEGQKKECCAKGKKCSKDKKSCDKDKKVEEKKS